MFDNFIKNNTIISIEVSYFDTLRLCRRKTNFNLVDNALSDAIDKLKLDEKWIPESMKEMLRLRGYTSIKIEKVFIKKWY